MIQKQNDPLRLTLSDGKLRKATSGLLVTWEGQPYFSDVLEANKWLEENQIDAIVFEEQDN